MVAAVAAAKNRSFTLCRSVLRHRRHRNWAVNHWNLFVRAFAISIDFSSSFFPHHPPPPPPPTRSLLSIFIFALKLLHKSLPPTNSECCAIITVQRHESHGKDEKFIYIFSGLGCEMLNIATFVLLCGQSRASRWVNSYIIITLGFHSDHVYWTDKREPQHNQRSHRRLESIMDSPHEFLAIPEFNDFLFASNSNIVMVVACAQMHFGDSFTHRRTSYRARRLRAYSEHTILFSQFHMLNMASCVSALCACLFHFQSVSSHSLAATPLILATHKTFRITREISVAFFFIFVFGGWLCARVCVCFGCFECMRF